MIRPATIEDSDRIRVLIESYSIGEMLPRSQYEIVRTIQNYFVYENGNGVVGCVGLGIPWQDMAEIISLTVDPNEPNNWGIKNLLIDACIEKAKKLKFRKIITITHTCHDMFKDRGFKQVERMSLPLPALAECITCPIMEHCESVGFIKEI